MFLLTIRDIRHRLVRFVIVTTVAAVVFALLFVMNGLVEQFHREPVDTVSSFGADGWVLASGMGGPFTSASTVRIVEADQVEAAERTPFVIARSTLHRQMPKRPTLTREVMVVGHLPDRLGAPRIVKGRGARSADEAVIDRSAGIRVGDDVTLGRTHYRVVGLTANATVLAGIPLTYIDLSRAQDIAFGSRAVVTGFLVRGDVAALPPTLHLRTNTQVAADTFQPLKNAIKTIDLVRALLWFVAAVIIGAVVFLSALERRRDFAVLKAVGTTDKTLAASLAMQAVAIALVGVFAAVGLQLLLRPAFPLRIRVPIADYWRVPALAALASLVAAAAAMRSVSRTDPATAFAGAGG